jgi:hypothetical protein
MRAVNVVTEPMLIVCENIRVEKSSSDQCTFILHYGDSEMRLEAESDDDLFKWMIKVGHF